ncbi:MAG TPA: DUF2878 family protein [bacterium]|nr:DUF2878 family protein [bacterium]
MSAGTLPEATTWRQVGKEMFFIFLPLVALFFFVENTPVMTVLIALIIIFRFVLIGQRNDWIFMAIGVIAGGGNDLLSMLKGVYYYTPQHILPAPIPVWMLFFWGHIFVAFRQLFRLPVYRDFTGQDNPWRIDARLVADIAVVVLFRVIIYNTVKNEPLPTLGYAAVLAVRLILLPPRPYEWKLMFMVMVLGPLFEGALIALGLYVYFDPVFMGMPAWLLIYWAFILPIFMKNIFDRAEVALARKG